VSRYVADLGNTRLKLGRLGSDGTMVETLSLPAAPGPGLLEALHRWLPPTEPPGRWGIVSVNPPAAAHLQALLEERGQTIAAYYSSAADVPVRHALEFPERTGADRAVLVWSALDEMHRGPGLVVSCGTAITVERISSDGVWQGGAIAAGMGLAARALHRQTAQLPLVAPDRPRAAWGPETQAAISAGVFWGAVGAVRELIARQSEGLGSPPWILWAGGDAELLAEWAGRPVDRVVPDLVLRGLARLLGSRE
jgi:type III pantothenate kinase